MKYTKYGNFMNKLCYDKAMYLNKHRWLYFLLNFTWGGILTYTGLLVSLILLIMGKKPKKFQFIYFQQIGEDWGGLELGISFIINNGGCLELKEHEFGHTFQNAILGPFMILLVSIPSMIRYWYRRLVKSDKPYESVWFEGCATDIGVEVVYENILNRRKKTDANI